MPAYAQTAHDVHLRLNPNPAISRLGAKSNLLIRRSVLTEIKTTRLISILFVIFAGGCSSNEAHVNGPGAAVTERAYDRASSMARMVLNQDPENRKAQAILKYAGYEDNMLFAAFWEDDVEAVRHIAEVFHDVHMVEDRFNTPVLVLAAAWGKTDMVRVLLEAGTDPNQGVDTSGYTALMWAAKHFDEQFNMAKMLLEAGASVDPRSKHGETALDIAREYDNPNIEDLLKKYASWE